MGNFSQTAEKITQKRYGIHEKSAMYNFIVAMFYLPEPGTKEASKLCLRRIVEEYTKNLRLDEVSYLHLAHSRVVQKTLNQQCDLGY